MKKVIFSPQSESTIKAEDLKKKGVQQGKILVHVFQNQAHLYVHGVIDHFIYWVSCPGYVSARSDSFEEMLDKFNENNLGEFYLFDSLQEFCEVAQERGWK